MLVYFTGYYFFNSSNWPDRYNQSFIMWLEFVLGFSSPQIKSSFQFNLKFLNKTLKRSIVPFDVSLWKCNENSSLRRENWNSDFDWNWQYSMKKIVFQFSLSEVKNSSSGHLTEKLSYRGLLHMICDIHVIKCISHILIYNMCDIYVFIIYHTYCKKLLHQSVITFTKFHHF